ALQPGGTGSASIACGTTMFPVDACADRGTDRQDCDANFSDTLLDVKAGDVAGSPTAQPLDLREGPCTLTITGRKDDTRGISGPALQGEQTEFTDSAGRYIVTELPPGSDYVVRFYFSNIKVERPGVTLNADKTLQVNALVPTATAQTQTYRITERAPTVDVG